MVCFLRGALLRQPLPFVHVVAATFRDIINDAPVVLLRQAAPSRKSSSSGSRSLCLGTAVFYVYVVLAFKVFLEDQAFVEFDLTGAWT